jgi:quercetin dioxygenase-like cupin family protein
MQTINLITLGNGLEVDKDHSLRSFERGELLLIKLKPQDYPYEVHQKPETIIAFKGQFALETKDNSIQVNEGESITVPPGIDHRFGSQSDALILVLFEQA